MKLRSTFEKILEAIVVTLLVCLALVVVAGVGFRWGGSALVWYDEVASILLAWLTYYGASLAVLKKAHIGFPTLVEKLPSSPGRVALVLRELVVVGFFLVMAWAGLQVMSALSGTYLISLPWMPVQVVQSVIPIGAVLCILAELLGLPDRFSAQKSGYANRRRTQE